MYLAIKLGLHDASQPIDLPARALPCIPFHLVLFMIHFPYACCDSYWLVYGTVTWEDNGSSCVPTLLLSKQHILRSRYVSRQTNILAKVRGKVVVRLGLTNLELGEAKPPVWSAILA